MGFVPTVTPYWGSLVACWEIPDNWKKSKGLTNTSEIKSQSRETLLNISADRLQRCWVMTNRRCWDLNLKAPPRSHMQDELQVKADLIQDSLGGPNRPNFLMLTTKLMTQITLKLKITVGINSFITFVRHKCLKGVRHLKLSSTLHQQHKIRSLFAFEDIEKCNPSDVNNQKYKKKIVLVCSWWTDTYLDCCLFLIPCKAIILFIYKNSCSDSVRQSFK